MLEALSKDELRAVLGQAKASRERDWLMILVAFAHGLRASEVTGFTADAVRDGYITNQRLKGSLKTTQALVEHPDPLFNERQPLEEFIRNQTTAGRVFPISRVQFFRLFQRYAKAAGIPAHKCHPHVVKHSIAMQTIKIAGIENVRQHLGHKSLSSTGEYLKVSDEEAGKAIRGALPD